MILVRGQAKRNALIVALVAMTESVDVAAVEIRSYGEAMGDVRPTNYLKDKHPRKSGGKRKRRHRGQGWSD